MVRLDWWRLFMATVEGRPSQASCAWSSGAPAFDPQPIPPGSEPNLKLLAEMLRSDAEVPAEVRRWLADLVDPEGTSEFHFKRLSKRGRGARVKGVAVNWEAASAFERYCSEGMARKQAIWRVQQEFSLSRASVEAAAKSLRAARAAHDAASCDDTP